MLSRGSRVLVEADDHAREKPAHRILPEDRIILGPGSSRWSPADDFTQAVALAARASHPELVRDAREWRAALSKLQKTRGWNLEELHAHLAEAGIHRELATLHGWLELDHAAPIGPRHIRNELSLLWPLVAEHAQSTATEVAKACECLRSLRFAAGRALLQLWQGRTVDLGIDETWLQELVEQLRQEIQVHIVDAVSYGLVPQSLIGWWITPELASRYEAAPDASLDDDGTVEVGEDE